MNMIRHAAEWNGQGWYQVLCQKAYFQKVSFDNRTKQSRPERHRSSSTLKGNLFSSQPFFSLVDQTFLLFVQA